MTDIIYHLTQSHVRSGGGLCSIQIDDIVFDLYGIYGTQYTYTLNETPHDTENTDCR